MKKRKHDADVIKTSSLVCSPHLWGDVVRGTTEGARGQAFIHVFLTHAKVCYLDVAFGVQHHVVQLQIPMVQQKDLLCMLVFMCLRERNGSERRRVWRCSVCVCAFVSCGSKCVHTVFVSRFLVCFWKSLILTNLYTSNQREDKNISHSAFSSTLGNDALSYMYLSLTHIGNTEKLPH